MSKEDWMLQGANWVFVVFWVLSVAAVVVFSVLSRRQYKEKKKNKHFLSWHQKFSVGILIGVFLVFIPVYYCSETFNCGVPVLRPLLIAAHNTLRVFILDGEFEIVDTAVLALPQGPGAIFAFYAAALYVVAPIMTATFILSLFKGLNNKWRFQCTGRKNVYIFSELNRRSIALAESISNKEKDTPIAIVFTDVFEKNDETDYELMERAQNLGAICMKQDVTLLVPRFAKWSKQEYWVEYFLMGEDESENISQASRIVQDFRESEQKRPVKVFVFASSPESEYMVGSIANYIGSKSEKTTEGKPPLMIRRVDAVEKLVWSELRDMELFQKADSDGVISVMLVGMGKYGRSFFKNLIWAYQAYGYRLELNVVDKRKPGEHGSIRGVLEHECPELMALNGNCTDGDANYSVEFFEGVDAESDDLDQLILYAGDDVRKQAQASRLRRTAVVIVAMGDDDRNIRVAMDLRMRFDRLRGVAAKMNRKREQEELDIYAVVYDEQKTSILTSDAASNHLVDYKNVPFNIRFIGNLSVQYDYSKIYEQELEKDAYRFHQLWIFQNIRAKKELDAMSREELAAEAEKDPSLRRFLEAGGFEPWELAVGDEEEQQRIYEFFEYYRKSSMARALHKAILEEAFPDRFKNVDPQVCMCEDCLWKKKTEHIRWNAYMRSRGYRKGASHISRSKLHCDLVPFDELPWKSRIKD